MTPNHISYFPRNYFIALQKVKNKNDIKLMHSHFTLKLNIFILIELLSPMHIAWKFTQNVAFLFFQFWYFLPIFVLLKLTCLVTLFDSKLQVFKNSINWIIFWHFPAIFALLKLTWLVTLFNHILLVFKNSLNWTFLAFSGDFCSTKTDLSRNTVWQQTSSFQKPTKMDHFWHS